MKDTTKTIVLARKEMTGRQETGNWERYNGNYYPEFVPAPVVKAMIWLNRGDESDVKKAKEYAAKEGYSVLTFPTTESDPLNTAKLALA